MKYKKGLASNMILGVDFDNTLACYDGIFHKEALKKGLLPQGIATHKSAVRDYLRSINKEPLFTELQGHVYGPGIFSASAYAGAVQCLRMLIEKGVTVYIVSHKTKHPIIGPQHDLHDFARKWLAEHGFYAAGLLTEDACFFEESRDAKLARIARLACTHFVDDLPEVLSAPHFPAATKGLLFSPLTEDSDSNSDSNGGDTQACEHFSSWASLQAYLLNDAS